MRSLLRSKSRSPPAVVASDVVVAGGPFYYATPTKSPPPSSSSSSSSSRGNGRRSPSLSPTSLSFGSSSSDNKNDDGAGEVRSTNHKYVRTSFAVVVWLVLSALLIMWHEISPLATTTPQPWWMIDSVVLEQRDDPAATFAGSNIDDYDRYGLPPPPPPLSPLDAAAFLETGLPGGYASFAEMQDRAVRFPSVAMRVQIYMTDWFTIECNSSNNDNNTRRSAITTATASSSVQYTYVSDDEMPPLLLIREKEEPAFATAPPPRTFVLDSALAEKGARVFYLNADEMRRCDDPSCRDVVQYIFPSLHRIDMAAASSSLSSLSAHSQSPPHAYVGNALDGRDGNTNGVVPILLQFGDLEVSRAYVPLSHGNETYPIVPIFKKFRPSRSVESVEAAAAATTPCGTAERPTTNHPIIAKLTYKRHFGMLDEIPAADVPWSEKYDGAVFRGALTGVNRNNRVLKNLATTTQNMTWCLQVQRCRLVYRYRHSTIVNASLVDVLSEQHHHNLVVPSVLDDGTSLFGQRLSYSELLKYKAIIMLEGNDVSSGLKWALYSNSVVLMPRPTFTSWAMEERLAPWVHYVPLRDDLSDVEDRVRWVIDHPDQAQAIAYAGTLWISDLVYHPHADDDDDAIVREMFLRYKRHFQHDPDLATFGNLAFH